MHGGCVLGSDAANAADCAGEQDRIDDDLMIGEQIGNYRMVRAIGNGATSTVYEAVHEGIGRHAAVKVLHQDLTRDRELVSRFFQEARAVNIIQHPGIVGVLECGQLADGTTYIVMEYLEGESLAERLTRYSGSLPMAEALRFSRQLASALSVAHQKGIVHRDVKPSNIMIVADAEAVGGERTKILDFGLAKLSAENVSESKRLELTRPGMAMGTPLYMPPEQFQGTKIDAKCDVYSLGATLYQVLAGRPPFLGTNTAELSAAHLYEAPRPLTERVPEISEELSSLVLSMLAKKPADRPSMEQVVKGLEQLGAPKATDSIPIVRRPSRDGDRMAADGVDPFASTIGQIAVRTQRWLNSVAQRRAVIATGVVMAAMTPLALLLHMHREPPRIDGTASPQSSRVNDVKAAVIPLPVPPLPAAPRDIRLSLQTDPPGAEVLRVADGVLLGRTPWTMSRPADQGRLPVLLRLPGHQELRVDLDLAQDSERVEVLRPVPPSASKRDHRSKSARKRGNQPGEPAAVEPDTGPDVVEPIPRIVE